MADASPRLSLAVPSALSLLRIALAAAFPFLGPPWRIAAVVAAGITDGLDGYAARKLGVVSWWGAMIDAATDKLFTLTVLIVITIEQRLEWWQLALLLTRDAAVLALLAAFVARRDWSTLRHMDHRFLGKAATAAQLTLLVWLIALPQWRTLSALLLGIAIAVTAAAAIDYLLKLGPTLTSRRPKPLAA